jgi:SAM-dependent methyltransferase
MTAGEYVGGELWIFSHALNWKRYFASLLRPYLGRHVLEVGAGIGGTTVALCDSGVHEWVCLEPAESLHRVLEERIRSEELGGSCEARLGTLADLDPDESFDTILYVDVVEHIEDDRAEAMAASRHLKPGGRLIVLAPAHQWLASPFDEAVGHVRRYTRRTLAELEPAGCIEERFLYLDSAGMLLSLANKVLLRQSIPTVRQVLLWDRWVVPVSKVLDRVQKFKVGKSIVGIWKLTGK